MTLINFYYLCFVDGQRQQIAYDNKSFSSFSRSGSSGTVFSCLKSKTPAFKPGALSNRSVSKIFDCVGLTKPQLISKLMNFCYLRFYAAILSNVAKLTTLKKQSHKVLFTVPEMAINLQIKHCQSDFILLSICCEKMKNVKKFGRILPSLSFSGDI